MNLIKTVGVILLVLCWMQLGCVSSTLDTGNKLDGQRVAQIQKGVTPIATLIAEFGPPQSKTITSDSGEQYQFNSMSGTSGAGGPLAFLGMPTEVRATRSMKTLIVTVRNGIVVDYSYSEAN